MSTSPTSPDFQSANGVPLAAKGGSGGKPAKGGKGSGSQPLTTSQRNAYTMIQGVLGQWDLQGLAKHVLQWVQQGYDSNAIQYLLTQTDAYKNRFAGNELRAKAGLPVLSPSEYIATERAYRQIMQSSGLPIGFYDNHADFTNLIGGDISPSEVQSRVQQAAQFVKSSDPNLRAALQQYHGIGTGDLVAYYLDPKHATADLQKISDEATVGQAALDQGLNLPGQGRVDQYLDQGFNPANAQQAFSDVAAVLPDTKKLGQIYGTDYTQTDAENEFLGGLASANRKRRQLAQQETDTFSGGSGIGRDSFAQASGSF